MLPPWKARILSQLGTITIKNTHCIFLRFLWGYNYAFCRNFKNTQLYVLGGYVRITKERIRGRGISWVSSSLGTFCKWLCDHHEDISRPRPGLAFCASAGWLWARLGQTCWPDATAAGSAAFCSSARTRTYSVYTVHWDIPCVHIVHWNIPCHTADALIPRDTLCTERSALVHTLRYTVLRCEIVTDYISDQSWCKTWQASCPKAAWAWTWVTDQAGRWSKLSQKMQVRQVRYLARVLG